MLRLPENNTWVISDTHFNHKNIIQYTGRPYANLEEMNAALIRLWQERVKPDDYIIHCGDFFMGRKEDAEPILAQLPGVKILMRGNHDPLIKRMNLERYFAVVDNRLVVQVGKDVAVLSHEPIEVWENAHKGWWHLHGHSHGSSRYLGGRLDVGVDAFCAPSGAPRSWLDVRTHLSSEHRKYIPQDHHGASL